MKMNPNKSLYLDVSKITYDMIITLINYYWCNGLIIEIFELQTINNFHEKYCNHNPTSWQESYDAECVSFHLLLRGPNCTVSS